MSATSDRARRLLIDSPDCAYAVLAPPWRWDDGEPHFEPAVARLWVWNDARRALVRKTTIVTDRAGDHVATVASDVYLPLDRLVSLSTH